MNRALVKTIENRHDIWRLNPSRMRVNDLLSKRVFVVIINEEVRTKPITQEGVVVLKNDFHRISCVLLKALARQRNTALTILDFFRLQSLTVDLCEFYACPKEI